MPDLIDPPVFIRIARIPRSRWWRDEFHWQWMCACAHPFSVRARTRKHVKRLARIHNETRHRQSAG